MGECSLTGFQLDAMFDSICYVNVKKYFFVKVNVFDPRYATSSFDKLGDIVECLLA